LFSIVGSNSYFILAHSIRGRAGHVARDAVDSGEVTSSLVVVANFLSLTNFVTMRGGVAAIDLFFSNTWYPSDRDITLLLPLSGLDREVLAIFSVRLDSFDGIVVIQTFDREVKMYRVRYSE